MQALGEVAPVVKIAFTQRGMKTHWRAGRRRPGERPRATSRHNYDIKPDSVPLTKDIICHNHYE